MSNTEAGPEELLCPVEPGARVLRPREVPLGGPRAMTVRRTLSHRDRSFVGAWCFVDHYGPDTVADTGGMVVAPHPHTGLQTVSWLFDGEIEHRDSAGVHAMVRPGEVNLMTAGHGICHSEVSTPSTDVLHGVQLWVVLPASARDSERGFQHYAAPLVGLAGGLDARVFIGALAGVSSPVETATPLLGAELHLDAGAAVELPVDPGHEHALLVDTGAVTFCAEPLERGDLGVVDAGRNSLALVADVPSRAILLGGEPFGEQVVMWWNFIGTDDAQIRQFRDEWQQHSGRFGEVGGYVGPPGTPDRLDAPPVPGTRLKPRGRIRR